MRLPEKTFTSLVMASSAAALLLSAIDLCAAREAVDRRFVVWNVGLTILLGACNGLAWWALFSLGARLPRALLRILWPLLFCLLGLYAASDLGGLSHLTGKYWRLAVALLGLFSLAGTSLGVAAYYLQPSPQDPAGGRPSGRAATLLHGYLAATVAVSLWVDAHCFRWLYPTFHDALRLLSLWALMLLLHSLLSHPQLRLLRRTSLVAPCFLLSTVPFLTIGPAHQSSLRPILEAPYAGLSLRVFRYLLDVDRDGYSAILAGGDCDDFEARVNPGRAEVPGNGIDDNCLGGDAPLKASRHIIFAAPDAKTPVPANVVLVTVEALNVHRLSLFGYPRVTTPRLLAWSRQARVFTRAYAAGAWTALSIPTLFRGVLPRRMGWRAVACTSRERLLDRRSESALQPGETIATYHTVQTEDEPLRPLPWFLQRRGMRTLAVVDDGPTELLSAALMREGFHEYLEVDDLPEARRNDAGTVSLAVNALERLESGTPFFLWVHFFGPHEPSTRHPEANLPEWGDAELDRYDHEVAFLDQQLDRLLVAVDRHRSSRPTAIIVAGDHGENIADPKQRFHGLDLQEDSIRIPLLIRMAGWPAGRSDSLVSTIDLMPTILALTASPIPQALDGRDLREVGRQTAVSPSRILISDTWRLTNRGKLSIDRAAAYDGDTKVTYDLVTHTNSWVRQAQGEPPIEAKRDGGRLQETLVRYLEETGGSPRTDY